MKRGFTHLVLLLLSLSLLGCGGYVNSPHGNSGVETYGVIDVGVGARR